MQQLEGKYRHFRYAPWTDHTQIRREPVKLAPSVLIEGTVGLFSTAPVKKGVPVLPYPGVLMCDEWERQLSTLYNVPTTVQMRDLDYYVDAATAKKLGLDPDKKEAGRNAHECWRVQVVLCGDPTRGGALMNSPFNTGRVANCDLKRLANWKSCLTPLAAGKFSVSSMYVQMRRNGVRMEIDAEFLVAYDNKDRGKKQSMQRTVSTDYWEGHEEAEHYCLTCNVRFVEELAASDPMAACSFVSPAGAACDAHRHHRCFEPGNFEYKAADWYCVRHAQQHGFFVDFSTSSSVKATPPRAAASSASGDPSRLFGRLHVTPPHLVLASQRMEAASSSRRALLGRFEIAARSMASDPPHSSQSFGRSSYAPGEAAFDPSAAAAAGLSKALSFASTQSRLVKLASSSAAAPSSSAASAASSSSLSLLAQAADDDVAMADAAALEPDEQADYDMDCSKSDSSAESSEHDAMSDLDDVPSSASESSASGSESAFDGSDGSASDESRACNLSSRRATAAPPGPGGPPVRGRSGASTLQPKARLLAADTSGEAVAPTEAGCQQMLGVWDKHRPIILAALKAQGRRRAFGLLDIKRVTPTTVKRHCSGLVESIGLIRGCCGKHISDEGSSEQKAQYKRRFGNAAALLDSRLTFYGNHGFAKFKF